MPQRPLERLIIPAFFVAYLLLGVAVFPDYGMSWDEETQRRHGLVSLDYVYETLGISGEKRAPDIELATYDRRHYAILFSIACAQLEEWFGMENYREQFLFRHLAVFLQFWLASVFFYLLLKRRFSSRRWALLGTLLLILMPRIFAHSFYNPKDIVMLVWYLISFYTLVRLLEKPGLGRAAVHGLACAVAINVRITGILLPVLTLTFLVFHLLFSRSGNRNAPKTLAAAAVYLLVAGGLSIAFWPYLWEAPLSRFTEAFGAMSQYQWEGTIRYFGEIVNSLAVPWHYPLGYLFATTPPTYLLLFLTGTAWAIAGQFRDLRQGRFFGSLADRADLGALAFCFAPLLAVILLNSTLYDGWRHLYFIYPPLLYLAVTALYRLQQKWRPLFKKIVWALLILDMTWTTFFMIAFHPLQNVYFSPLAGTGKLERFEMDYWGNSYKQALEELLRRDTTGRPLVVYFSNYPGEMNYHFLPEEQRQRIKVVFKREEAAYYFSNYRNQGHIHLLKNGQFPYDRELFTIDVLGEKVVGVYVLPQ